MDRALFDLQHTTLFRNGASSTYSTAVDAKIGLASSHITGRIEIYFAIPAAGGGKTEINLTLQPEEFSTLLMAISHAHPERAVEAYSAEIRRLASGQTQTTGRGG